MQVASTPLTWSTVLGSWSLDVTTAVLIIGVGLAYGWCARRGRLRGAPLEAGRLWCSGVGLGVWVLATMSMIGIYADVLFWVRALQVVLLLLVVPFFLALGQPVTALGNALGPGGRRRMDRVLGGRCARVLAYPLTTSVAMLGIPWLLYLTPWYPATLENASVASLTRMMLVVAGFGYFYSRLQTDPVPRRYSQLLSLVISIAETIGDGLLGLVLWLGPLIAADHYLGLHRSWGPSLRLDQTIGAGIIWILGDVLGVPFLIVLMRALSTDEKARAVEVDAELDRVEQPPQLPGAASTLWWENDPQLADRFRRR